MEELLTQWQASLKQPDEAARAAAKHQWDSIAKPLGSLGALEKLVMDIAALTGDPQVDISRRAVVVCCADNGVVAEGVTQTGQEVTARMAGEMANMESSVCRMAKVAHADVIPVDMGMVRRVEGVLDRHVMDGTQDMARRPAMTREQALEALWIGIDAARRARGLRGDGHRQHHHVQRLDGSHAETAGGDRHGPGSRAQRRGSKPENMGHRAGHEYRRWQRHPRRRTPRHHTICSL